MSREQLVGRGPELALLRQWLAEAAAGSGRLVLVGAPAGLGKTRLVEELAASAGNIAVGWGEAIHEAGMPPLWPWRRAAQTLTGLRAALEDAYGVFGSTGATLAGSANDAAVVEFAAQTATLDALESFAGAHGGLLLVIDDLHWADEMSLRLLDRLAATVRRSEILVIATYRNVTSGGFAGALPGLLARAGTEVISLGPLAPADGRTLVENMVANCDARAVRTVVERAAGNPLYLRTIARVAPDLLRNPTTDSDAIGRLPELHDLVTDALQVADPGDAAAVEALSVLGIEADLVVLAETAGRSTADVFELLRPTVTAGLVEIHGGRRVRLTHALVRDAVYNRMDPRRRAELHRRAAEVLQRRAVLEDRGLAGEIAHHWRQAGYDVASARWAVQAAAVAARSGAHGEAAAHLRRAIDSMTEDPGEAQLNPVDLLLEFARAAYLSGDLAGSIDACERAADEGLRIGDNSSVLARAAVIVQGVADPVLIDRVEQLCRRALPGLDAAADPGLRSRVEAQLAHIAREKGDLAAATDWSERALRHALSSSDLVAELDAVCARAPLTAVPGRAAERLELGRRAVELALPTGRPMAELWGRTWRADAHLESADVAAAQGELAALAALAQRTQLPLARWHLLRRRAAWAALTGDFDQALLLSTAADESAEALQDVSARGVHMGFLLFLARLRGDVDDIPEHVLQAFATAPPLPVVLACRAFALLVTGHPQEAEAAYRALPLDALDPTDPIVLPMLVYVIELAVHFQDLPGCRRIADTLRVIHQTSAVMGSGTVLILGSVARALGRVQLIAAGPDVAIPLFEEGIRIDTILGARPFVAQGRLELSAALTRRGSRGDLQRARNLAVRAAADARRLDMPGMVSAADMLLTTITARARHSDPLTPRERQVAEFVAHALSNREIAAHLVLSERTVEGHVRNILAKTGLTSRSELIRRILQESTTDP